jgi:glycosyltransferase involved in cell wall biosynthesis
MRSSNDPSYLLLDSRKSSDIFVTFYIPNLNEKNAIVPTCEKLRKVSNEIGITYELLIVDDNSNDNSVAVVHDYLTANLTIKNWKIIENRERRGIGFNYGTAAELGHGKFICMVCADNSETYGSLIKMISIVQKNDVSKTYGGVVPNFENNDSRTPPRRITSKVFVRLCQVISGLKYSYFNGPTIHRRKNVARFKPQSSGYAFQAELLCTLTYLGYQFTEVTIDNHDREEGKSRAFNFKNLVSVSHSLLQILFMRIRNFFWPSTNAVDWDDSAE